jgi:Ras-related protein Rab-2A
VGAFLVYDITNRDSFLNLKGWLEKIREYSDPSIKIAIVGNKKDLVEGPDPNNETSKKTMFRDLIEDNDGEKD